MQKILAVLLLGSCLNAAAGTEGRTTRTDNGVSHFRHPRVAIPAGWAVDEETTHLAENLVMVPQGKRAIDSSVALYAWAKPRNRSLTSKAALDSFIKEALALFKEDNAESTITPRSDIKDRDNNTWRVVDFVYPSNEGFNYHNTVAYLVEGNYGFELGLSTRSERELNSLRPLFISWVSNYKNLPDSMDIGSKHLSIDSEKTAPKKRK